MLHKLTRAYFSAGGLGLCSRLRPEQRKSLAGTRRQSHAPSRNCRRWGGKKQRRNMFHRRQMIPTTIAGNASAAQRTDTATNERCLCHIYHVLAWSRTHAHKQSIQTRAGGADTRKKLFERTRKPGSYGVAATTRRQQETNNNNNKSRWQWNSVSLSLGAMRRCKVEMKAFRRQWCRTIRYKASILSFPATPPSP